MLNKHVAKEDIQMHKKHKKKKCSTLLSTKKMEIKEIILNTLLAGETKTSYTTIWWPR